MYLYSLLIQITNSHFDARNGNVSSPHTSPNQSAADHGQVHVNHRQSQSVDRNGNNEVRNYMHQEIRGRPTTKYNDYAAASQNSAAMQTPPHPVPRKFSQQIMTPYQNIPNTAKAATDPRSASVVGARIDTATPNRYQESEIDSPTDFRRSASARLPKSRFSQDDSDENKKNSDQV